MKNTLEEITGLRGVAAFLILLNHTLLLLPSLKESFLYPFLMRCGILGMSLFFCLSGFVIYYNYGEKIQNYPKTEIIRFFIARFARIYPLYFIFLLGFVFFCILRTQGPVLQAHLTAIPIFFACMQSWFFGIINGFQVVHLLDSANISWSISTEFGLYSLFVPAIFLLKWKKTLLSVIIFSVSMVLFHIIYDYMCYSSGIAEVLASLFSCKSHKTFFFLINYFPLGRFLEFLAGCGAAMLFDLRLQEKHLPVRVALLVLALLLILDSCTLRLFQFVTSDFSLLSLAVVLLLFASVLGKSRFLSSRLLVFMGEVSYSVYLLHIVFVKMLCYHGEKFISMLSTVAVFLIGVYVCGYLAYRFYEIPCRKLIRKIFIP